MEMIIVMFAGHNPLMPVHVFNHRVGMFFIISVLKKKYKLDGLAQEFYLIIVYVLYVNNG